MQLGVGEIPLPLPLRNIISDIPWAWVRSQKPQQAQAWSASLSSAHLLGHKPPLQQSHRQAADAPGGLRARTVAELTHSLELEQSKSKSIAEHSNAPAGSLFPASPRSSSHAALPGHTLAVTVPPPPQASCFGCCRFSRRTLSHTNCC